MRNQRSIDFTEKNTWLYGEEDNDFFTLHVFEKNKSAIRFYWKMGLRTIESEVNEDLGEVEYRMFYKRPKQEEAV